MKPRPSAADFPSLEAITEILALMEQAGWQQKGFAMTRADHIAIVGLDGRINVDGPKHDANVPRTLDEILDPLPGDGTRKHDA